MGEGRGCDLLVSMCSSMHEVLDSVPRTMERKQGEREEKVGMWGSTSGHSFICLLPSWPSGLPSFSILWFLKKESFSYATSVKGPSALFFTKNPFPTPHEVDKMAHVVVADPRLSWWKERRTLLSGPLSFVHVCECVHRVNCNTVFSVIPDNDLHLG